MYIVKFIGKNKRQNILVRFALFENVTHELWKVKDNILEYPKNSIIENIQYHFLFSRKWHQLRPVYFYKFGLKIKKKIFGKPPTDIFFGLVVEMIR